MLRATPVPCRAELSPFLRFELPDECSEMRGDGSRQRIGQFARLRRIQRFYCEWDLTFFQTDGFCHNTERHTDESGSRSGRLWRRDRA